MAQPLEPGEEGYKISGDRPPDGHIADFATWDPTNHLGFRSDDPKFPAPAINDAMRRRDEAEVLTTDIIKEHVAATLDTKESLEDIVYKSTRPTSGVKPEEIFDNSITNTHAKVADAFNVWLSGTYPKAKNIGEVICMMDGTYIEPEEPLAQVWPPKGSELVSEIEKRQKRDE